MVLHIDLVFYKYNFFELHFGKMCYCQFCLASGQGWRAPSWGALTFASSILATRLGPSGCFQLMYWT